MDQRIKALLEVALVFVAIFAILLIASLRIFSFIKASVWPISSNIIIFYVASTAFILILLAITGRDFSRYGLSLRNAGPDLKVVAICAIPMVLISLLILVVNIDTIERSILVSTIEALMLLVIAILLKGVKNRDDKAAAGTFIIIPAVLTLPLAMMGGVAVMLVYIFLFVGPVEELIFRGYLQSRLNEAFGRPHRFFGVSWGAGLVIASLLFGLWHMLMGFNPFYDSYSLFLPWGIETFVTGLTLGFIREKTNGLVAPALLHALIDVPLMIFPML